MNCHEHINPREAKIVGFGLIALAFITAIVMWFL